MKTIFILSGFLFALNLFATEEMEGIYIAKSETTNEIYELSLNVEKDGTGEDAHFFHLTKAMQREEGKNETSIVGKYKIDKKKSLRLELQYMSTKQDYGSWAFALLEFNIAPSWAFAVSDMYNITPNKKHVKEAHHYPNIFVAYTKDSHRFTAQYVKQVDGINCTGGVCRYEPAFSGFKIGITSSF